MASEKERRMNDNITIGKSCESFIATMERAGNEKGYDISVVEAKELLLIFIDEVFNSPNVTIDEILTDSDKE